LWLDQASSRGCRTMRARDLIERDGATAREKTGFAVNRRRAIAPFPQGGGSVDTLH
jgi:hypothetical protein